MSTNTLREFVGKTGTVKLGALLFNVVVRDVKQAYGKTRYQVEPESGSGTEWKDADGVKLIEPIPTSGTV